VLGTAARPAVMPMDAGREGEEFIVEFDLPGIKNVPWNWTSNETL
jgi:HSP20 family protein